jgi:hypothetical protein
MAMKAWFILISLVLFMLGCGDNNGETVNDCFSKTSSNPCFDPNTGGSTTTVTDKTTDQVIAEQESQSGFKDELPITSIVKTIAFVSTPPSLPSGCTWEENELVIRTQEDWNRFRDSCFFSAFSSRTGTALPDIDFSTQMVLVSMQDMGGLGTEIVSVLEFNLDVVVVIRDDESSVPPPAIGFPFHIVSVTRRDLSVNFIRVKNVVSP